MIEATSRKQQQEVAKADIATSLMNLEMLAQLRSGVVPQRVGIRKNLSQLKKSLDEKNRLFLFNANQLNKCSNVMKQQGVNIEKEQQQAVILSKQIVKRKEVQKDTEDCNFYIPNIYWQSIGSCLFKICDFNMMNNVQQNFMITDAPGALKQQRKKNKKNQKQLTQSTTIKSVHQVAVRTALSTRNQAKQKHYNKIICQYVKTGRRLTASQLARLFLNQPNVNPIWSVLIRQLQKTEIQKNFKNLEIIEDILNTSIGMIQTEYSSQLPEQIYAVESVVKSNLLSKPQLKRVSIYYEPKTGRPIWAIVYTLLKAGRINDIHRLDLQYTKRQFIEDLRGYQSGKQVQKQKADRNQVDLFYDTIYNIFNRSASVQQVLIQTGRDLLWFALKTINLHNPGEGDLSLEELQTLIQRKHQQQGSTQSLVNLIYCMAYDDLLLQAGIYLDVDDCMHVLIYLKLLGFIKRGLLKKNNQQFDLELYAYTQDLVGMGLDVCVCYLLLAYDPEQPSSKNKVLQLIERFIVDRNLVEEFFGAFPKADSKYLIELRKTFPLDKQDLQPMVQRIAESLQKKFSRYVYPSQLYTNILQQPTQGLECLINLKLVELSQQRQIDESEKKEAGRLTEKFYKEGMFTHQQKLLLEFIRSYSSLCAAMDNRNKLESQLLKNKCVPTTQHVDQNTATLLNTLNMRGQLKVYLMFFQMVVNAVEVDAAYRPTGTSRARRQQLAVFFRRFKQLDIVQSNIQTLKPMLSKMSNMFVLLQSS